MLRGTWLMLLLAAPPLGAQAELSAGVGAGSIRYSGGASVATVLLTPAAALSGPNGIVGVSGAVGPLDRGDWGAQLRADLWGQWPTGGALRPAASVVLDGSVQTGGPATGAAHVLGEALWTSDGRGAAVGVGPSVGAIASTDPVSVLRTRARVWGRIGAAVATVAIEPQLLEGAWFTDVSLGATTPAGRVTVSGWLAARLSESYDSRAAGSLAIQVALSDRLSVEAAGGSLLADLYQGFPASGFVTLGLRAFLVPRAAPLRTVSARLRPAMAVREGDSVHVRFRLPTATAVSIAGNWNDWRPVPLSRVGSDVWEARFALATGVYQFVLIVDGSRWMVPARVARVSDGMGGEAGLLIAP